MSYLWLIEYDVVQSMRHTRTEHVVTNISQPSAAENVFKKQSEDWPNVDFIRKIEFEREVLSEE